MKPKAFILFICFLSINVSLYSQPENIDELIDGAIAYLNGTQIKETRYPHAFRGEWHGIYENRKTIPILGVKGKEFFDSNCFITASIHNILAEIYLQNPVFTAIPVMLDYSMDNILKFENNGAFNFWHLLPVEIANDTVLKRRSNGHVWRNKFVVNQFNIVDDADDTAAALRSIKLYNNVKRVNLEQQCCLNEPDSIYRIFKAFKDVNRDKANWYNRIKKHGRNTGAFLTWFGEENLKLFYKPSKTNTNLPLGRNDIDCVVNANILIALADYNEIEMLTEDTRIYIERIIEEGTCNDCEIYYPTPNSFVYSIAKAIDKGFELEQHFINVLVTDLLNNQNKNGTWKAYKSESELQSTLLATNALLSLQGHCDFDLILAIDTAMKYILSELKRDGEYCFWDAGVYFSLGGFTGDAQLWRSQAYTTALALEALVQFKKIITFPKQLVRE